MYWLLHYKYFKFFVNWTLNVEQHFLLHRDVLDFNLQSSFEHKKKYITNQFSLYTVSNNVYKYRQKWQITLASHVERSLPKDFAKLNGTCYSRGWFPFISFFIIIFTFFLMAAQKSLSPSKVPTYKKHSSLNHISKMNGYFNEVVYQFRLHPVPWSNWRCFIVIKIEGISIYLRQIAEIGNKIWNRLEINQALITH